MNTLSKLPFLLILLTLLPITEIEAQVGTSFWFVAPEVSRSHGDDPVSFRITAFDEPATVDIAMPANGFSDQITVPANTQVNYEGLSNLDLIENRPSDQILDKGILITSDEDISIYYDVADHHNPDKFTLKANNALGTEFFVPSQTAFDNHNYNNHPAREHIDIVATEDNTEIEIIPTDDVIGHNAGDTVRVTLNRGQTFGLIATNDGERANRHLGGTEIQSNNPIAVTISDDSAERPADPGHWDLIGDQLIPTDLLGTEYIAMHTLYGEAIKTGQKVFILAIEDDTYLAVGGVYKATLSKGELHELTIGNNALYIQTDKPVYAYQVTGIPPSDNDNATRGTELGSAILPNITCTGSSSVSFTRVLGDRFFVQLMVRESDRGSFSISGPNDSNNTPPTDYLDNPDWVKVPGTGLNGEEAWYSTVIQMGWDSGVGIATGNPYTIKNDGLFHMSILDENSVSMSFGYFSDYSTLRINGLTMECLGQTITLETEDPMLSYYWFSERDPHNHFSEDPSVDITESGKYWVNAEVESGGCFLADTIDVEFRTPEFTLGNDTVVCPGELVTYDIQATNPSDRFLWSPGGETSNSISVTPDAGEDLQISLTVTDDMGCSTTDDVTVSGYSAPAISWNITGNDICRGDTLKTTIEMAGYQWTVNGVSDPADTLSYIIPDADGTYELTVRTDNLCSDTQSLDLTVHDLPVVNLADVWVCPGESGTFTLNGHSSYLWHNGATSSSITVSQADSVAVTVTNNQGCLSTDSAYFGLYNEHIFTFGEDTSACENSDIRIEVDDGFSNYQWTFRQDGTGPEQPLGTTNHIYTLSPATMSDEGLYKVLAKDPNGCDVEDEFFLTIQNVPDLNIEADDICHGDTIRIETPNHRFTSFAWTLQSNPTDTISNLRFARVSQAATYNLQAWQDNGCSATASTTIGFLDSPDFDLTDVISCPDVNVTIGVENWQPANGTPPSPASYEWSTGPLRQPVSSEATLQNPHAGKYYLTVRDDRCFTTDSVEVIYHDLPDITLNNEESCDNEPFTLEIPPALLPVTNSYRWSQEGTSSQGPLSSPWDVNQAGDYRLTITDNNGCISSETMTLNHLPSPDFSLGADRDKCTGDTIMVKSDPFFERYEWNGNHADGQTNYLATTTTGLQSLQVWGDNGCSSTAQVNIVANPLPSVDLGPDITGCAGETVTLNVPSYPEIYWSNGQKNVTSVTVERGKHSVRVVDSNGCTVKDSMNLVWHSVPSVDLGPDLFICPVEYPVDIEAPAGFQGYEWHNGQTNRTIAANLMDTLNHVTVTDINGCKGWDTKVVSTFATPVYSLGNDTSACEPDEIVLDAGTEIRSSYAGEEQISFIQNYRWSNGASDQTETVDQSGMMWVEVFDGCFYLRDSIEVEFFTAPEITALDTTYYAQVSVIAENGSKPYTYGLNNENDLGPENTFKNVPNGEHTAYVEDKNGCTALTVFNLNSQYEIDIPDFFTPNNDGFNDTWKIEGLEKLPESLVSIFDRYGKLLREFNASETISWNGEYLNKPVPSDDYWYVIHLKPIDKLIKGHVTVKR